MKLDERETPGVSGTLVHGRFRMTTGKSRPLAGLFNVLATLGSLRVGELWWLDSRSETGSVLGTSVTMLAIDESTMNETEESVLRVEGEIYLENRTSLRLSIYDS
jgi:hypothetical protein